MPDVPSYTDLPGLTSRANSAMCRIEMIMARTDVSSAARLVLIAKVMRDEPVLTDGSTAAKIARQEAKERGEYGDTLRDGDPVWVEGLGSAVLDWAVRAGQRRVLIDGESESRYVSSRSLRPREANPTWETVAGFADLKVEDYVRLERQSRLDTLPNGVTTLTTEAAYEGWVEYTAHGMIVLLGHPIRFVEEQENYIVKRAKKVMLFD